LAGGASEQIFKDGVKGLAKQEAKFIIKQLGEDVIVAAIRTGKKKRKIEVELVLKKIPDQDAYQVVTQGGFPPPKPTTLSAEQVASDVEKAVEAGRTVKTSGSLNIKATSETAQQAAKNAQGMDDAQLEKAINDPKNPAVFRKEYKEILDKRKSNKPAEVKPAEPTPAPEAPKAGSQEAANLERARVDYKKLSDSELQTIYNGRDEVFNSWQKQAAKETLESRGIKPGVTKVEPTPASKVDPVKTPDDVLQAKKTAAAEAEAKAAMDAGNLKIKEDGLLPAKPGETDWERFIRSLEQDPKYKDKWDSLKGTKGEEGFWQYVGKRKVATILTALTVAAIAAGVYNSNKEPEEIDDGPDPEEVDLDAATAEADAAKKKAEADAAKKKAEKEQGASTTEKDGKETDGKETDGKETDGKETDGVADNSAEQQELLTQINALIAKLSKSKDPAIQKRLAAVRKKLGQTDQAASVVSKDEPYVASGWYDIGQGYRRWYGKDGVDPTTGRKVTTGTTDITPSDGVQHRDKYANMSQLELANLARRNAASGNPAKTKSNWENK
jgi:hypothetical protein